MKLIKTVPIPVLSQSDLDRFWSKVDVRERNECWPWLAGKDKDGYGKFRLQRRMCRSHRIAYFIKFGPLTPGFTIDHLCTNRSCSNAFHYELVPIKINGLRGNSPTATHARKTCCPKCGNRFSFRSDGGRRCKICRAIYMKNYYKNKLAKVV